jgi:hypothetical protein
MSVKLLCGEHAAQNTNEAEILKTHTHTHTHTTEEGIRLRGLCCSRRTVVDRNKPHDLCICCMFVPSHGTLLSHLRVSISTTTHAIAQTSAGGPISGRHVWQRFDPHPYNQSTANFERSSHDSTTTALSKDLLAISSLSCMRC